MDRRRRKEAVWAILAEGGPGLDDMFAQLAAFPALEAVNALFPFLCRVEERLRWRAVSGMGASIARLADADMEAARTAVRRLLWSLNEESGGIGWGAPEALAETLCRHEGLAREYAHMLVSYLREDGPEPFQEGNFLEHPLLRRGLLWGIARLGATRPELLRQHGVGADLPPFLACGDAFARGMACVAAGNLGVWAARGRLRHLVADSAPLIWYNDGLFKPTRVAALAETALKQLEKVHYDD